VIFEDGLGKVGMWSIGPAKASPKANPKNCSKLASLASNTSHLNLLAFNMVNALHYALTIVTPVYLFYGLG
jgi:hypothetical protein